MVNNDTSSSADKVSTATSALFSQMLQISQTNFFDCLLRLQPSTSPHATYTSSSCMNAYIASSAHP